MRKTGRKRECAVALEVTLCSILRGNGLERMRIRIGAPVTRVYSPFYRLVDKQQGLMEFEHAAWWEIGLAEIAMKKERPKLRGLPEMYRSRQNQSNFVW